MSPYLRGTWDNSQGPSWLPTSGALSGLTLSTQVPLNTRTSCPYTLTDPGPVPLIVYSANSTVTWRQTTARCRQTGTSSAAELRAEGEVETKIVFPVPQFWECTSLPAHPLLATRENQTSSRPALCFTGSHCRARPSFIHR